MRTAAIGNDDEPGLVCGKLMQRALGRLLDQVPGVRRSLPHLAALENSLGRDGLAAVEKIPPHWLARIMSQLDNLLPEGEEAPLRDLLARLQQARADRPAGRPR